ncbi:MULTISPECIES: hypothetical protein [Bacteroidota]|uniref:hypothetical protein n=1 Tax=uncultured Sphingobacterium sp. TaxID=182688 RepID=UPI0025951DAC|nr:MULTISPECIES: hypothetical protein [Bacteroidota]
MAKNNKIDIKALTSAIKQKGTADTVTDQPKEATVETAVIDAPKVKEEPEAAIVQSQEVEAKTDADPIELTQEKETVVSEQPKTVVKGVSASKVESVASSSFDLNEVINWERPETIGKKKLVELAKEYDTFFAKVKATTGIPTVKFVNYLVRDFLRKNPDFVHFINEESGRSPQLE